jgi:two-component system NtrC family response regulator
MAHVLIIDDDEMICDMLSTMVRQMGHEVRCANTLQDGLQASSSEEYDVVFLDVRMPDGSGLDILPRIRGAPSAPEVIIITGFGDPDGAELAIKNGAWDYIEKPSSIKAMTLPLVRALQYRDEKQARKPAVAINQEGIVGSGPSMRACIGLVAQAANSEANVLITGETGTGKELFAYAIHNNSLHADKSFVVVDCAALPENLVESMLFGHERGAFTGADRVQDGLIKQADGGTLFLDEVGELPLSIQSSFLRVLQERRFRPIGGKREIESNFRLVAATNRDLEAMVKQGQFRKELLFRLRSFTIELPSLREHPEDIKELVLFYTAKICERYGTETKGFSPEFFDALLSYDWPGNVRELVNTMERAIAAARQDPILFPKHLPTHIRVDVARASITKEAPTSDSSERSPGPLVETLSPLRDFRENAISEAEQHYLHDLMSRTGGNIKEACKISGLSRPRLYALLKKYHISKSD